MLARAFMDDPAWAWVVPSSKRRAALLPWLFRVNFEVTEAQAWTTEGIVGCARWLPPGRPQIHVGPMLKALVATPLRAREATSRFFAYGRAVEAMRASRGARAALVPGGDRRRPRPPPQRHRHRADAAGHRGLRARPRPLRAAHKQRGEPLLLRTRGFEIVREGRTPEEGPRAWMMLRKPSV